MIRATFKGGRKFRSIVSPKKQYTLKLASSKMAELERFAEENNLVAELEIIIHENNSVLFRDKFSVGQGLSNNNLLLLVSRTLNTTFKETPQEEKDALIEKLTNAMHEEVVSEEQTNSIGNLKLDKLLSIKQKLKEKKYQKVEAKRQAEEARRAQEAAEAEQQAEEARRAQEAEQTQEENDTYMAGKKSLRPFSLKRVKSIIRSNNLSISRHKKNENHPTVSVAADIPEDEKALIFAKTQFLKELVEEKKEIEAEYRKQTRYKKELARRNKRYKPWSISKFLFIVSGTLICIQVYINIKSGNPALTLPDWIINIDSSFKEVIETLSKRRS
ncbi:hypothetical protein [Bacillus paralicheniformis]|uniref:hypothetical protein n=1 Tax=Bacillus paralicheniformis TaxID=1648923 RepID=UPI002DC036C7|nr:hypothetical protein [Bacillus paralicheniformis]MEC1170714.1 hypothetical protein [Bacillus paralicheniformis]MEC1215364.1 hypothetical protein [Bacillus paralicheniformis]MEC1224065.1 hypothetical protein [Bacillus paralicheniformis]MEC1225502.1 hypothetical protein [Bacillus paralicheniformis]MEC1276577.1 hypothetical protein [Bacillus paralicheniformis]